MFALCWRRRFTSCVGVAAVLIATIYAPGRVEAMSASPLRLAQLSAQASGSRVTVSTTVTSTVTTTVRRYGVCVRSAHNVNLDYVKSSDVQLAKAGKNYIATKSFSAGRYKYFACVLSLNNVWQNVGAAKYFVVSAGAAAAGSTGPNPSGERMPVGNTPGWTQIVAQDFTTNASLGSFTALSYPGVTAYSGFRDTSGHGIYSPNKVLSTSGGLLDYYLHTSGNTPLVSAVSPNLPTGSGGQIYGKYSIRFRSDVVPGYKLAFLLWPDSDNWREGEIDFPEVDNLSTGSYIYANRYAAGRAKLTADAAGFKTAVAAAGSGWHTATIEWLPTGITYYLDGVKLGTTTTGIPKTRMHLVLQVETRVNGSPVPSSTVEGHVQVDWVTIYRPS